MSYLRQQNTAPRPPKRSSGPFRRWLRYPAAHGWKTIVRRVFLRGEFGQDVIPRMLERPDGNSKRREQSAEIVDFMTAIRVFDGAASKV